MFERLSLDALKAAGRQYIAAADLVVVAVGSLSAVLEFIPSHSADVPKNASQFSYALKPETVSTVACFILTIIVPMLWMIAELIASREYGKFVSAAMGLLEAFAVQLFICEVYKLYAGRPRPFFHAATEKELYSLDKFKSFPSAHSSISFACLGFFTLYLCGKEKIFASHAPVRCDKAVLCFVPLFAAGLIAISRTKDNFHHFSDIIAGCIIGMVCAAATYHRSKQSGSPKPMEDMVLPEKVTAME